MSMVLLTSLASCAPGEAVDGDPEGMYSPMIQGPIINSTDAIKLMSDNAQKFQQDQILIAYYAAIKPTQSPAWRYFHNAERRERLFQDDISHMLQIMDKLADASAPTSS